MKARAVLDLFEAYTCFAPLCVRFVQYGFEYLIKDDLGELIHIGISFHKPIARPNLWQLCRNMR